MNFGDNGKAARKAALTGTTPLLLRAGAHRIPLHRPVVRTVGSSLELSVLPVAVGWGVSLDGRAHLRLTAAELTELGHQLYGLLATFDGYVAACVGWDPEWRVDPVELEAEWSVELSEGSLHGLVLPERLHRDLGLGDEYVPFRPGYRWVPYRGESPGELIAD